jgi:proteic killer suppression protein
MKIVFSSKFSYLSSKKLTILKHGAINAKKIGRCLDTISACGSLHELENKHLFRCHLLKGNLKMCYGLDVQHPDRLVIKPVDPIPMKNNNEIDTSKVYEVEVVYLGDYHG